MTANIVGQESSTLATGNSVIRPFPKVTVPETELTELRRRINNTKWPERETRRTSISRFDVLTIITIARGLSFRMAIRHRRHKDSRYFENFGAHRCRKLQVMR